MSGIPPPPLTGNPPPSPDALPVEWALWVIKKVPTAKVAPLPVGARVAPPKGFPALASRDPGTIAQWETAKPGRNYALVGVVAVDVDIKKDAPGKGNWNAWCRGLGVAQSDLADCLTVRTASGGWHIIGALPDGDWCGKNGFAPKGIDLARKPKPDGKPGTTGIDLKGAGNTYVVCLGGRVTGQAGVVLTYDLVHAPEGAVGPLPAAMLASIKESIGAKIERCVARAIAPGADIDSDMAVAAARETAGAWEPSVEDNGGHTTLRDLVMRIGDLGLSASACVDLLTEPDGWNERCLPPWDDDDLEYQVTTMYDSRATRIGCSQPGATFAGVNIEVPADPTRVAPAPEQPQPNLCIRATAYRWPDPRSLPRRQWLFGFWLIRGEVTAIFAPGGAGKSTLSTAIAVSLASGRDLLGQAPHGHHGVWIYNLEDAPDELDRQIAAACLFHGIDRAACGDRLYVNSGITMPLCTATEAGKAISISEAAFVELTETIRRENISAVIIDPLVSSHRVSEASNEAMDAIAKRWKRLAYETGCAVGLVHHTRKLAGRDATAEDGRGAIALRDAARVVLVLNKVSADEAKNLGIADPLLCQSLVKVDMGKASRSPAMGSIWFKLESQSLGNGDGGGPPDHVGVAARFDRPDVFAGMTDWHLWQVQQRLGEIDWKDSASADDWVGRLVAEVAHLDAEADASKIKAILKEWKRVGFLVVEKRTDAKGTERPCIAIGKPMARPDIVLPPL